MSEAGGNAHEALAAVAETQERTRREVNWRGADTLFIMWGAIWFAANLITQFRPHMAGLAWLVLDIIGIAATIVILRRAHSRVPGAWFGRLMVFWLCLFGYAALWPFLLTPFNDRQEGMFVHTLVLFAFVVMGLWMHNRLLLWLGLLLTAALVAGYIWLGQWLWLWTALTGGAAFIGVGIFIRLKWRR